MAGMAVGEIDTPTPQDEAAFFAVIWRLGRRSSSTIWRSRPVRLLPPGGRIGRLLVDIEARAFALAA
jgi:hypothetical protein